MLSASSRVVNGKWIEVTREQKHSKILSAATCRIEIPRLSLLCARPVPVDEEETFANLNLNCTAIDGRSGFTSASIDIAP